MRGDRLERVWRAYLRQISRVELLRLLGNLAYTTGRAILLSTHDLDLALRVADRLWLLPTGGQLISGIPEELAFNGALADAFSSEGIEFDSALLMRGIKHEWHGRADLCCAAGDQPNAVTAYTASYPDDQGRCLWVST